MSGDEGLHKLDAWVRLAEQHQLLLDEMAAAHKRQSDEVLQLRCSLDGVKTKLQHLRGPIVAARHNQRDELLGFVAWLARRDVHVRRVEGHSAKPVDAHDLGRLVASFIAGER
jgi:hypothetical protein